MATITASQKFENEVKAVIAKGEADERASKASLPAAMQPAAVRQLLGGAVFEVAKSDGSGNLFGFNLGNNSGDATAQWLTREQPSPLRRRAQLRRRPQRAWRP